MRQYDGVICFGDSDWWYHNRGHYDMQIMRELSRHVPVLYVNSIGVRMPQLGEGRVFFQRVYRKLKSLGRGLVRVRQNFGVFSPLTVPGRFGSYVTKPVLAMQIKRAASRMGIHRPLAWVACPSGAAVVEDLGPVGVVYQRTDRYEDFPCVERALIESYDKSLKSRADVTLFCSSLLFREEAGRCRHAAFVDHGVDFERFAAAGQADCPQRDDAGRRPGFPGDSPEDRRCPPERKTIDEVRRIPRPRVGFVGGIDEHTFDPELFIEVARELSDVRFILVGACSLRDGWCGLPNVTLLGRVPYEHVAEYMAACDVLIMPWKRNDWIKACNPVKLKEYLAVGRPVVSTYFEELTKYEEVVRIAEGSKAFAMAIRDAIERPVDAARFRARVREHTWSAKARAVLDVLGALGLVPALA